MVSVTLLAGTSAFRKVCEKFKAIAPEVQDAGVRFCCVRGLPLGLGGACAAVSYCPLPP